LPTNYKGNDNVTFTYSAMVAANQGSGLTRHSICGAFGNFVIFHHRKTTNTPMGTFAARSTSAAEIWRTWQGFGIPGEAVTAWTCLQSRKQANAR